MSAIAEYKFNSSTDTLPEFNSGFTYTYTDVDNGDGTITRTIKSDSLPTSINFISSSIIELTYLNISNITDFTDMFHDCNNLVTVNTSDWDTSRVTSMCSMFNYCHRLTNIDLSNWDTSKVTNMNSMFSNCSYNLTSLDLSNWNTSKVTDMSYMFNNCDKLTSLDLSNWNIIDATIVTDMFNDTSKLSHIGMLYSNKETVEKIQAALPNVDDLQRTIWVQDTNEKDYASNEYVIVKEYGFEYGFEKQKVRLPQPLRAVGNYKDKLYWDNEKGKYCIEQNICIINLLDIINDDEPKEFFTDSSNGYIGDDYNYLYCLDSSLYNSIVNDEMLFSLQSIISTIPSGNEENPEGQDIFIKWGSYDFRICIKKSLASTFEELKAYIENSDPIKIYYPIYPTIIETDITEKIALNTYNPYMKITTNEKEIAPTNMVARFPYKDYFGNDVTVNNLSTDLSSVQKLNLDFNRGDYLEAKIDVSNVNTIIQAVFGLLDTDNTESYNLVFSLGIIKNNGVNSLYFEIAEGSNNEYKLIETTDNIIKFKINEKGIYINDIYTNPFDNQDLFNNLLESIKNLNIYYLHYMSNIPFDYVRTVQQNSDGDEIGHLGKYNHYYQTYTNYPVSIENENLCYIHDSYLTEIHGQTIQAIGYSVYRYVDGNNYINQPINITNRYQVFNIHCNKGNQNDIVYFRVNFTVNECNTEDTNHCGIISTRDGGGYNRLEYKFLKKDVGIRQWKSFTRVIDNTCSNNYLSCLVGLNEELPSGFTSNVDTVVNFTIHDYTCYNLTQLFGSGKEPTKEWCDKNLPYLDVNEIASFNENNNKIKLNISSCPVKFGGDK